MVCKSHRLMMRRITCLVLSCVAVAALNERNASSIEYVSLTKEQWRAELTHPSLYRQRLAIAHFSVDGVTYEDLLPLFIEKLEDPENNFKRSYTLYHCIGNYGEQALPHLPKLIDHLKFDYYQTHLAFKGIGPACLPALNEMLDSGLEQWQLNAARALKSIKFSSRNSRLYHWMVHGNDRVKVACAEAIWECYEDGKIAAYLIEVLNGEDSQAIRTAGRLISRMGGAAAYVEADLQEMLNQQPSRSGASYIRRALSSIARERQ